MLLLATVAIVASATFGDWMVLTPDSLGYLGAARSVWESQSLPGVRLVLPPGFPLLIAPLMARGDFPFTAIRAVLVVGWGAVSLLTYVYYRGELGRIRACAAALIIATSPAFLTQSSALLSELVFIPIALGALVVMQAWGRRNGASWPLVMAGAGLCAAAVLVRTMGVALLPVGIAFILRDGGGQVRQRFVRAIVFAAIALGPQLLWSAREAQYAGGYGYGEILTRPRAGEPADVGILQLQLHRLIHFGPARLETILQSVIPNRLGWRILQPGIAALAGWIIGGALLAALAWRFHRWRSPADGFALLLFALLALWPWDEGIRFVLPMLPMFAGIVATIGFSDKRTNPAAGSPRCRRISGSGAMFIAAALVGIQLCEAWTVGRSIAPRQAREAARVDRMRALAGEISERIADEAPIACIVPNESPAKIIIMGAAYLSRRQIERFVDVKEAGVDLAEFGAFHVLSDEWATEADLEHRVLLPESQEFRTTVVLIATH